MEREEPCRNSFKDWISWTAVALEPCASRHPMISSGKEPGANTGIMHAMQVTVYVHVWACHVVGYGRVGFIGFRVQSLFELKLGCGRGPQPTNGWLG